jgi:hypothetical protein
MAKAMAMRPMGEKVEFRADHPFLFLIRDNDSGTILFLGRVTNPGGKADGSKSGVKDLNFGGGDRHDPIR